MLGDMRRFRELLQNAALLATALAISAALPGPVRAQDGPFVYVPNSNTAVSIVDTPTGTVAATIGVGNGPFMAAARGDESLVYVTNQSDGTVSVIDTATNTVVTTISVGTTPVGIALSPDGTRAYVVSSNSGKVSVIDTATNTVVATITVGSFPIGVAVSPDGTRAYVANRNDNNVSVINTATNTVVTTIPVGSFPFVVTVSPDGARAYVTNLFGNNVSVINTATNAVVTTITVGTNPDGVTVSPDGTRAYVTNHGDNTVSVIDTATNTVVATISVGTTPEGVVVSPDGTRAYVANSNSSTVSIIDTATNTVIATLGVGTLPGLPGICSNGNALLASGLTFKANTSGALACTQASGASGASGPVFTGGTMQFAGAGIVSALPITLMAVGGSFDTAGNNATLSGTISGSGGLTKTGLGTLTLSGAGTYSGPTAVNGGTLQAGAANVFSPNSGYTIASGAILDLNDFNQTIGSLAGAGNVLLGAATLTAGGDNTSTTFSGVASGTGSLVKTGSGTLILSGANTYSGGTTISAGTLQAGAADVFGNNSAMTVASGAILDLAGFDQAIGSLAGAGNVLLGAAALTAGGDNTSTTFSGVASGTGGLTKTGTGTTILSGTNTYAGGTRINAGTLQLGDGGSTGSIAGDVTNNGIFAIDRSDSFTFVDVISGTGAFQQNGTGTTILSGTNTYTGATTVNAGTLSVNGSIGSSSGLTVNSGGTVGGTGTLPSTVIASGGALAPGNSIGTISVSGNLTFNAGSSYAVQVSPSAADRTNVTGTATLAGTVNAAFESGSYTTPSYTILSATGGLGGTTFDTLTTSNLPVNFIAGLSYTSTNVLLNLTAALGANLGLSGNQQNVADAINSYFNGGGTLTSGFSTLFGLSGNDLTNALSLVSGEAASGGQQGAFQLMSQFLGLMFDPDADGSGGSGGGASAFAAEQPAGFPAEVANAYAAALKAPASRAPDFARRWRVWGSGFGGYNATNGDAGAGTHDLIARSYGGAAGLDYRVSPDTVLGFALAGGGTNWGLAEGLGGGSSDAFLAGIHGRTHFGAAYVRAALAFANHWMSTDRYAYGGDDLGASFNAQSYGGRIEAGYRYALPVVAVTPYAALQAQGFHTPDYSETDLTSGGYGLSYAAHNATDTRSELGARFDKRMAVAGDATLNLRAGLAWLHDWTSDPSLTTSFQALPGSSFIVEGATPPKNSALVSAGAELRLAGGVSLLAKFDGNFAGGSRTYSGTGTLRYTW